MIDPGKEIPERNTRKPISLEGRWDILYRDYPEIYDEFAQMPKKPDLLEHLSGIFPLVGKLVLDVGSGTGDSSIKLAAFATQVVGIEIEESMIRVAKDRTSMRGIENVDFVLGNAERIEYPDQYFDHALAITLAGGDIRLVAAEMERVVKPGGVVLRADVAPGWYGGDLNPVITGASRDETPKPGSRDEILPSLGYDFLDIYSEQEFGTVECLVRTYGFIHSKNVVDYIQEHRLTKINWKFRIHYKYV